MYKYLRSILLTSLLIAALSATYAQPRSRQSVKKPTVNTAPAPTPKPDLLVRRDGTPEEVVVIEITDKEIVYKRFSNPNGPIYRVQKADVSSIKYGTNGEIERFTTVTQQVSTQPASVPVSAAPAQPVPVAAAPTQPASTPTPIYQTPQPAESFKWRMGVLIGAQSAGIAFNGEVPDGSGTGGFRGGVMIDRPIGRVVTVRTQVLYSTKGADVSLYSNGTIQSGLSLSYLEVPFDLLYKIPIRKVGVLLGGGFYWGTLLNATVGTRDIKDEIISSKDAGLRFSAWADLSKGLTMNVFYNYGLADISLSGSATMKNQSFGIGVGYFLLKK